jgi:hypothetical protein
MIEKVTTPYKAAAALFYLYNFTMTNFDNELRLRASTLNFFCPTVGANLPSTRYQYLFSSSLFWRCYARGSWATIAVLHINQSKEPYPVQQY